MTDVTRVLRREHQTVLGKLDEFERALERHDAAALRGALEFFDEKLAVHRKKEEEILFPALGRHIGTEVGPIACMLEEHRDEADKFRAFKEAISGDGGPDGRARVRAAGRDVLSHLRDHIQKEDTVLFPMAERLLSEEEKREVHANMETVGSCCPECAQAMVEPNVQKAAPEAYRNFVARHPLLEKSWDLLREAESTGPLDERAVRLVKLGIALGAYREGAVRSAARKARAAGVMEDELHQVVALAASTIGFPSVVAGESWILDAIA
ncbi:MAG: hemerythrin domain-containing protein [Planctomycetes bacterium]|nr:hemerythrin domain-containing protein [Planctomycetota bacterium]